MHNDIFIIFVQIFKTKKMKKLYFLFTLFIATLSFGQGLETFTNSNATASYASNSFTGDNGITWTYVASRDENADANASGISGKALMLRRVADLSSVASSSVAGGIGDFSVKLYKGFTGAGDRQVELFVNGISRGTSTVFDDYAEHIFTVTGINQPGNITIELRNTTSKQVIVDDISWTAYSGTASPSLAITSPTNAAVFNPSITSVNVNLSVANFSVATMGAGDGHIHYTINSLAQPMKYDTTPIAVPVTPGNTYTVYVELVDDAHNPIAPAVNATVTFDVSGITTVTTLADVRTDVIANGAGKYYEVTGEAIVTYARISRNQKYIQDATAGILIDDSTGTITNTFNIGDGITGLKGQAFDFNGLLEFIPIEDIAASSTGNTVTPQIVTIADVLATPENYESELLQINGVIFDTTNTTFATNTNVDITGPTATTFRPVFSEADYIGQNIPAIASNIICYAGQNTSAVPTAPNVYLVSRSLADLALSTNSFDAIEGLTMYPNPLSGNVLNFTSAINAEMNVQIFDILGKQILTSKVNNNTLNVSNLNAGIYIVKITEEGKTATRKLVVK
jgi:hypothetical protein